MVEVPDVAEAARSHSAGSIDMSRIHLILLLLVGLLLPAGGCTICQSHDDPAYAAFGGVWERQDPVSGRVGSAFEPAEGMAPGGRESAPTPLDPENGEYWDEDDDFHDDRFETSGSYAR
jgi:hypothetical protein